MMRVCFIETVGARLSGSQQSLLNLIDVLSEKYGVEPYIACRRHWELIDVAEQQGIKTTIIPVKKCLLYPMKNKLIQYLKYPLKRIYNAIQVSKAVRFLRENKIEVVHINTTWEPELWPQAAKKAGIPYVWHIREFLEADHNRSFLDKRFFGRQMREADCLIAVSHSVQAYWEKYLNCNNICVVYNGLPTEKYFIKRTQKSSGGLIECLMVGRIMESKGQLDAVKAIEILRNQGHDNMRLNIIGYRAINSYEMELKQYIDERGLNELVELIDFTYDMEEFRRKSDVGIICSKAEAFGRVTVEYMMAGMTVVGSNTGGTPEIIENGKTGYLYEYGNSEDLANQLSNIISHREEAEAVAMAGQESALKRFSIDRTAFEVNQIYLNVVSAIKEKQNALS